MKKPHIKKSTIKQLEKISLLLDTLVEELGYDYQALHDFDKEGIRDEFFVVPYEDIIEAAELVGNALIDFKDYP